MNKEDLMVVINHENGKVIVCDKPNKSISDYIAEDLQIDHDDYGVWYNAEVIDKRNQDNNELLDKLVIANNSLKDKVAIQECIINEAAQLLFKLRFDCEDAREFAKEHLSIKDYLELLMDENNIGIEDQTHILTNID